MTALVHATLSALRWRVLALRVYILLLGAAWLLTWLQSWWGIWLSVALSLTVTLSGWFLYQTVDCLIVGGWRRRVLRSWLTEGINLTVFARSVVGLPALPQATVRAMIATLPVTEPLRDAGLAAGERHVLTVLSDLRWVQSTSAAMLPGITAALLACGVLGVLAGSRPRWTLSVTVALAIVAWASQGVLIACYQVRLRRRWRALCLSEREAVAAAASDAAELRYH